MQEYQKAVTAVAQPSRQREFRDELSRASLEDLQLALDRAHNNGQKRRIRRQIEALTAQ